MPSEGGHEFSIRITPQTVPLLEWHESSLQGDMPVARDSVGITSSHLRYQRCL